MARSLSLAVICISIQIQLSINSFETV
jgi:hypothetical protein